MKKRASIIAATAILLLGLASPSMANAAPPESAEGATVAATSPSSLSADASVDATGQYEYRCVLTSGTTVSMAPGTPLTDCKGSYLQKYLDGRLIEIYHLTPTGAIANEAAPGCLIAVAATAALILKPDLSALWVTSAALAAGGIYTSCTA